MLGRQRPPLQGRVDSVRPQQEQPEEQEQQYRVSVGGRRPHLSTTSPPKRYRVSERNSVSGWPPTVSRTYPTGPAPAPERRCLGRAILLFAPPGANGSTQGVGKMQIRGHGRSPQRVRTPQAREREVNAWSSHPLVRTDRPREWVRCGSVGMAVRPRGCELHGAGKGNQRVEFAPPGANGLTQGVGKMQIRGHGRSPQGVRTPRGL